MGLAVGLVKVECGVKCCRQVEGVEVEGKGQSGV